MPSQALQDTDHQICVSTCLQMMNQLKARDSLKEIRFTQHISCHSFGCFYVDKACSHVGETLKKCSRWSNAILQVFTLRL